MWMPNRLLGAGVVAALVAGSPTGALAQEETPTSGVFKTAQQMYELCVSRSEEDQAACDWYIMAAHDMMKLYGDTNTGGLKICLPTGTQTIVVRNAVVNYWQQSPSSRRFSAVSTIYNALTGAFPC